MSLDSRYLLYIFHKNSWLDIKMLHWYLDAGNRLLRHIPSIFVTPHSPTINVCIGQTNMMTSRFEYFLITGACQLDFPLRPTFPAGWVGCPPCKSKFLIALLRKKWLDRISKYEKMVKNTLIVRWKL